MLSRFEKLHCFLKPFLSVQLPQAFEVPSDGWSPTRGVFQELMWMRIFFSKLKKKSQALSCKKQEVQPSLCSGVLQLVPMLFKYNPLLHSPFFASYWYACVGLPFHHQSFQTDNWRSVPWESAALAADQKRRAYCCQTGS